jgi:hypothetical protein
LPIIEMCQRCVSMMPEGDRLSGVVTVDLKEDETGRPFVTEINLRYIGFVHAYALARANVVEHHLAIIFGDEPACSDHVQEGEFYRGIDSVLEFYPDSQPINRAGNAPQRAKQT